MQGTLNTDPQITRTKIYPLPEKQMFLNLTLQPSSTSHPPSLPVRASHPPACQHGRERDRHPVLPAKWVTLVFQALKRWVSGKRAKSGSGWGSSVTDLRVWPGGGTGSSSRQARAVSGCTLRPRATSFCREAKVRDTFISCFWFLERKQFYFSTEALAQHVFVSVTVFIIVIICLCHIALIYLWQTFYIFFCNETTPWKGWVKKKGWRAFVEC